MPLKSGQEPDIVNELHYRVRWKTVSWRKNSRHSFLNFSKAHLHHTFLKKTVEAKNGVYADSKSEFDTWGPEPALACPGTPVVLCFGHSQPCISLLHLTSLWRHELLHILRLGQSLCEGPNSPLALSTRPLPIYHWPWPFNRVCICMKRNVCHSVTPHSHPSFPWWGGGGKCLETRPVFIVVPLDPALSDTPTNHRSSLPLHQVHSTMMLFLLYKGASFQIHMGCSPKSGSMWPWNHKNQDVYSTYVGSARIVFGDFGSGLAENTLRCRCYGLCWDEARAMRQVQPLAWLMRRQREASE